MPEPDLKRTSQLFGKNIRGYIRCLVLCLASLTIGPTAQAKDVTYGAYDEFTLFNADDGPLKNDILFLFHGFGSAMPNGAYRRLYNAFSEHFSVIGFNFDYFDLEANDEAMELVWTQVLAGRNVTFGGTSLGGFWANYYAEKYGVERVLLVNPVVDPVNQLKPLIGPYFVEKRNKEINVTAADVKRYTGRASAAKPGISRLIILSRDDDLLDYQLSVDKFSGADNTQEIFDEGGHTLDLSQERYLSVIDRFLFPEN